MNLKTQYRNILNRNAKILNISHLDLDGTAASIVVANVFNNVQYRYFRYDEVDNFLKTTDLSHFDVVLLTDISPNDSLLLEEIPNSFLLDHHDSALCQHNPEHNRIVKSGKSAALLCKDFFESLYGIDLSYLNDFCRIVNDYDMWINSDKMGWCLNELHFKYWSDVFRVRFMSGQISLSDDEKSFIKERRNKYTQIMDNLQIYELETIKGSFILASEFVNDLCSDLLKNDNEIVICLNPRNKNCSIRINDSDIHIGNILKELDFGGGHKQAGGIREPDPIKFKTKLDILENLLYNRYRHIRR